MNRSLILVLILVAAGTAHRTTAAVFERDWKIAGDGLLTYDDVNQREWLDLPVSLMVKFPGTPLNEKFDNAVAELQGGGMFEGFILADGGDVAGLAQSAGIDITTTDYDTNHLATAALVDLLGETRTIESGGAVSTGFLNELGGTPPICPCQRTTSILYDTSRSLAGVTYSNSIGGVDAPLVYSIVGLMLYRPVPEPSSIVLLVSAILLLGGRRHRGRQIKLVISK